MIKKIKNYFKKRTFDYTKKFKSYELAENYLTINNIYFGKTIDYIFGDLLLTI